MPSSPLRSPRAEGDESAQRLVEASRRAEIVALVNAASTEAEIAEVATGELCEAFEAEIALVLLASPNGAPHTVVGRRGLDAEQAVLAAVHPVVAAALAADRVQTFQGQDALGVGARRVALTSWASANGRQVLIGVARIHDTPFRPSELALLEAIAESVGHALERAWLASERDRHVARQSALVRAATAVNASLVREEVLDSLSVELEGVLDADLVAVCLDDEGEGLVTVAGRGLGEEAIGRRLTRDGGLCARVVEEGRALAGQPLAGQPIWDMPGVPALRAGLAAPLRRGGRVDGVVLVGYAGERWIPDADLELLGAFAELAGLACRNADAHATARRAATLDPLTGCLNHGAFQTRLREEIARAERSGRPLALVVLDLDEFKAVNDQLGHLTGDALLRSIAEVLRGLVRSYDQVARWGGDEFGLLLPATEEATARRVLDRALDGLKRTPMPGGDLVRASAGLAAWRPGEQAPDLLERADRALLDAKRVSRGGGEARAGRGRTPRAEPGEDGERWRRLATVGHLGTRLARLLDQRAIAETAIAELGAALGYERCLLVRRGEDGSLALVAAGTEVATGGEVLPDPDPGFGLAGALRRSLAEQRAILVTDAGLDPAYRDGAAPGVRSELAVPVYVGSELWGAIGLRSSRAGAFGDDDAQLVQSVADHLGAALRTAELYHKLDQTYLGTAAALAAALEAKDSYTADHAGSIAELACLMGREMELDEAEIRELRYGAIFHDIGKIAIPDAILSKPERLSEEEMEVVRRHPEVGEQILAPVPFLSGVRRIVRHDHERWDGAGYPDGLREHDIPLGARIVLVADAFHAMTSDRPYRPAMDLPAARRELLAHAGTQFDPDAVMALLRVLERQADAASA